MAQKRESAIAELREEMSLQVGLRLEQEVRKTLQLVAGLYPRLGHHVAEDPELDARLATGARVAADPRSRLGRSRRRRRASLRPEAGLPASPRPGTRAESDPVRRLRGRHRPSAAIRQPARASRARPSERLARRRPRSQELR